MSSPEDVTSDPLVKLAGDDLIDFMDDDEDPCGLRLKSPGVNSPQDSPGLTSPLRLPDSAPLSLFGLMVTQPSCDETLEDMMDKEGRTDETDHTPKEHVSVTEIEKEDFSKKDVTDGKEDKAENKDIHTEEKDIFDLSVLELPGTSHLNLDLNKHKMSLSKKGSISRRKRPTLVAIRGKREENEDALYQDSTEPRSPRSPSPESEDDKDLEVTSQMEATKTSEPSRNLMKIPGLLDGLKKSKSFSKGQRSAGAERPKLSTISKTTEDIDKTTKPSTPGLLPSLLPLKSQSMLKPIAKIAKDSQNESTARRTTEPMKSEDRKLSPDSKLHLNMDISKVIVKQDMKGNLTNESITKLSSLGSTSRLTRPLPSGSLIKSAANRKPPPVVARKPVLTAKPKAVSKDTPSKKGMRVLPNEPLVPEPNKAKISPSIDDVDSKKSMSKERNGAIEEISHQQPQEDSAFHPRTSILKPISPSEEKFKQNLNTSFERDTKEMQTPSVENGVTNSLFINKTELSETTSVSQSESSNPDIAQESCVPERKSSIVHVEAPSMKDRNLDGTGRKGSIGGSAYVAIGFRSQLSSDSEQDANLVKRNNSVLSVSSQTFSIKGKSSSKLNTDDDGSSRSRSESLVKVNEKKEPSPTTANKWSTEKPSLVLKKGLGERKLDAEDINRKISNLDKTGQENTPVTGRTESAETSKVLKSPWGVQLRKVDKKTMTPSLKTTDTNKDSAVAWKQQMSVKRRSFIPPPEPEKPKVDEKPEWAQALVARRKRLRDSGVINVDVK